MEDDIVNIKLKTKHTVFKYNETDEKLIRELNDYLDKNIDRIYNFFDNKLTHEQTIINIFETKKDFDNFYKKIYNLDYTYEVPNWLIGFTDPTTMEIYYLSLNDYKNTSHSFKEEEFNNKLQYYKKTILHEYVHYIHYLFCIKNKCDLPAKYLTEGLAQYLSNQIDDENFEFNYTIDDILDSSDCYKGWYIITKYLIENYSHDFVINLLKNKENSIKFLKEILYNEVKEYYSKNKKNLL